jgi:8-oxo-dGTP diphosphatase
MNTLNIAPSERIIFEAIKDGTKTVETRAAIEKYTSVNIGDLVTVICGEEELIMQVVSKQVFPTIDALFEVVPLKQVVPFAQTIDEAKEIYYSFPNYAEKIPQYGIVAFTLARPFRNRVGVLIVRNKKILLIYRKNAKGQYYVIPGGGVEVGETPEQAAIREMREEAGVEITLGEKLYEQQSKDENQHQYFYSAEIIGDIEDIVWQEQEKQLLNNVYRFEWVPLSKVVNIALKPAEIVPLITVLR